MGEQKNSKIHRLTPFCILLVVWIVHAQSSVLTSGDSRWFLPTAVSIIEEGNISLDEYAARIEQDRFYGIEQVDGHYYNLFPIGTALLALPPVWCVNEWLDEGLGLSLQDLLQQDRMARLERLIASLFVALAAVIIYLTAKRQLGGIGLPLLIAVIFAFASPAWSTASRALWQHGPSMLLLAASLYAIIYHGEKAIWPTALAGPLLAMAYVVRPTNALSFAFLMGVLLWYSRKTFAAALGLSLLVFGPFVLFNLHLYGEMLPPYFASSRLHIGPTFFEALAGNLISPGRGLLLFTPVFLFSFYGIYIALRSDEARIRHLALTGIIAVHWVCISMFDHWWGGYSIGPRFFSDMTPYFVFFLMPALDRMRQRPLRRTALCWVLFLLLLGISVHAHYRSANSWRVPAWNETPVSIDKNPARVWDWKDIQFLRRRDTLPVD